MGAQSTSMPFTPAGVEDTGEADSQGVRRILPQNSVQSPALGRLMHPSLNLTQTKRGLCPHPSLEGAFPDNHVGNRPVACLVSAQRG